MHPRSSGGFQTGGSSRPTRATTCVGHRSEAQTCSPPSTTFTRVRTPDGEATGLQQLSYVVFISQAREQATGELAHLHWFTYTEDPAGVPGRYGDGVLARIIRSQTFSKHRRGDTQVREIFSAVGESGEVLSGTQ